MIRQPFYLNIAIELPQLERHSEKKFSTYTDLESILLIFTANFFYNFLKLCPLEIECNIVALAPYNKLEIQFSFPFITTNLYVKIFKNVK